MRTQGPRPLTVLFLWLSVIIVMAVALANMASAQVPPGYYDSADTSNAATLRGTLHDIIDDHTRYPYTATGTDTWDILEIADQDPDLPGNVITVYRNASYLKQGGGNELYNREHSWPKSYGFPAEGSTNYPYTDAHHLFIFSEQGIQGRFDHRQEFQLEFVRAGLVAALAVRSHDFGHGIMCRVKPGHLREGFR